MKKVLDISDNELTLAISSAFNLDLVSFEFIPIGEASWLYKAASDNNELFIVKIQKKVDSAPSEIIAQLTENEFEWIPRSYLTNEQLLWAKIGDYYFSVQEYIDTDELHHAASSPTNDFLIELGKGLASLHQQELDRSKLPHVSRETFKPNEFTKAQELIKTLQQTNNDSLDEVKQVFNLRKNEINQLFANTMSYGDMLKNTLNQLCVVHGDMHFGNILKPLNDHLYLIDWDHSTYSLPEMDLMYFTDEQIIKISKGYGKDLLENRIAIQYFRNYLLVRALEFYLSKLLNTNLIDKDIADSLIGIYDMSPYFERALAPIE
jgi:thiamine kinase-like enzyme